MIEHLVESLLTVELRVSQEIIYSYAENTKPASDPGRIVPVSPEDTCSLIFFLSKTDMVVQKDCSANLFDTPPQNHIIVPCPITDRSGQSKPAILTGTVV